MKVGSTDEFLLHLHFVPVLFTTITFFPWHYKTFCQISRLRVSSINNRPKMTFDDAGCWSQGWSGVWSHERPWSTKSRPSPSLLSTISPSTSQQISVRTSGWRASVRRPTGWARSTPCTRREKFRIHVYETYNLGGLHNFPLWRVKDKTEPQKSQKESCYICEKVCIIWRPIL